MPSANGKPSDPAAAKSSGSAESASGGLENQNPVQAIVKIIEHKIRNLEKRKTKLDGYRELHHKGQKLTQDQRAAVAKYDEVKHALDLSKELCKQFQAIAKEATKQEKREAKRAAFVRQQQEAAKIREVLVIQDTLRMMADDAVRQDFLDGTGGAVKIEQEDMDLLEKFYVEVTPKRPTRSDETPFVSSVKVAADTYSSVIDGRNKSFGDSTYEHVRAILQSIQTCGYFEKDIVQVEEESQAEEQEVAVESQEVAVESVTAVEAPVVVNNVAAVESAPVVAVAKVPAPETLLQPSTGLPPLPATTGPTTVRAVEQHAFLRQYVQAPAPPQPQPTMRPIHEVIGASGNFFFLQESELDSSDLIPTTTPPLGVQQQQPQQPPVPLLPDPSPLKAAPPTPQPHATQPFAPTANQGFVGMQQAPPQQPAPQQAHIPSFTNGPSVPSPAIQPPPATIIHPIPTLPQAIPGFVTAANAQFSQQMQSMMLSTPQQQQQHQQQPLSEADLTEKLKTTLQINSSPKQAATMTPAPPQPVPPPSAAHHNNVIEEWKDSDSGGEITTWNDEMQKSERERGDRSGGGSGGYSSRKSNSRGDKGGRDGGGGYRSRQNYQNGGSSVFFRNNDRNYYQDSYGSGGDGGGRGGRGDGKQRDNGYKPRSDTRGGGGRNNGGSGGEYRQQQRPNSGGHSSRGNPRGVKA